MKVVKCFLGSGIKEEKGTRRRLLHAIQTRNRDANRAWCGIAGRERILVNSSRVEIEDDRRAAETCL